MSECAMSERKKHQFGMHETIVECSAYCRHCGLLRCQEYHIKIEKLQADLARERELNTAHAKTYDETLRAKDSEINDLKIKLQRCYVMMRF